MKYHIKNRILSLAGESIAETLIALLVSSFALVMLAGAISSGSATVQKGKDTLKHYYENIEYIVNNNGIHDDNVGNGTDKITITDKSDESEVSFNISYYYDKTFGKTPVIKYKYKAS